MSISLKEIPKNKIRKILEKHSDSSDSDEIVIDEKNNVKFTYKELTDFLNEPPHFSIYTDGGCRPNPGDAGWGFYSERLGDEGKNVYCMGFGGIEGVSTNNAAEIKALAEAFKYLPKETNEVSGPWSAEFFIDSKYVIKNFETLNKTAANDFKDKEGNPIANHMEWKELHAASNERKDSGTWKVTWVKGHSGVYGNEEADKAATYGIVCTRNCNYDINYVRGTVGKKLPKPKVMIHPFIAGSRGIHYIGEETKKIEDLYFYASSTFTDKKEDKLKNAGKLASDTLVTACLIKEPVEVFDSLLKGFDKERMPGTMALSYVDRIKQKWSEVVDSPVPLVSNKRTAVLTMEKEPLIGSPENPHIFYKLEDNVSFLVTQLYGRYKDGELKVVTDITDLIYTTSSKGKITIAKDFGVPRKTFDVKINPSVDKDYVVNVGIDIPIRNMFSALLKMDDTIPVSVKLVCYEEEQFGFRFFCVIERDGELLLTYSPQSNLRLIAPK